MIEPLLSFPRIVAFSSATVFHSQKIEVVFLQFPNHDYLRVFWLLCFGHFWALMTLGDHSAETATFWIRAFFPVLNKHRELFFFLPFISTLICHLVPGLAASVFA